MVRVVVFGDYPPCPTGGATVNYHLVKVLKGYGFDVSVITHIAGMHRHYEFDGVKVTGGMNGKFNYDFVVNWLSFLKPNIAILSGTWFLWRNVVSALAYHNIPFIAYITSEGEVEGEYVGCLNLAEKIFTPSEFVKLNLARKVKPNRLEILPHGIDVTIFKPLIVPDKIIFYPARWDDPRKQTDKLVEAFKLKFDKLKNFKLMFSGKFTPPSDLSRHIVSLWSLDRFRPPSIAEMAKHYSKAKVVVNIGKAEGFGMISIEALACMRPVLTFDIQPFNEVVSDRELLVRVAYRKRETIEVIMGGEVIRHPIMANIPDIQDLAEKMVYLAENPQIIHEKGYRWREHIERNYNYKNNYLKVCREIDELVKR